MLKENWRFISRVQRFSDLIIVCLAFLCAYYGRSSLLYWNQLVGLNIPFQGHQLAPLKDYVLVLLGALTGYALTLARVRAYNSMRIVELPRLVYQIVLSTLVVFFFLAALLFVCKVDLSRSFIILFCVLAATFLILERYIVLAFLRYWRRRGRNFRNVIVVGTGLQAARIAGEIVARPELGIGIKRFASLAFSCNSVNERRNRCQFDTLVSKNPRLRTVPIIYSVEQVEASLESDAIDEIIFTDVASIMMDVERLVRSCADRGIRTTIAGDLFSLGITKSDISYFGGMPLIHFQTPPGDRWELGLKRIIDFTGSMMLIILFAPLMLLIAILVKLTSNGPVLFKQKRVGLNGRIFSLYKFRSMVDSAEKQQQQLQSLNEMQGPAFKIKNDPRVTKLGAFLRRYSLDELPQLWNVVRGDMSLVGPRPPIPGEVSLYLRTDRRRLSMRPGLTCIWQVNGRSAIKDFQTWVKLDLDYIDNWSLAGDIILLIKTIPVVLLGKGGH